MAYAFHPYKAETMARAQIRDAPLAFKTSVMVAQKLRGMMTDKASAYLTQVAEAKAAVPFTRYRNGVGHRTAMGAGKFPKKASLAFLELVKQGVANAESKGLGTPLKILHVVAQPGSRPQRGGRKGGVAFKRTHIELVLVETDASKRSAKKGKKESRADVKPAETKDEAVQHGD